MNPYATLLLLAFMGCRVVLAQPPACVGSEVCTPVRSLPGIDRANAVKQSATSRGTPVKAYAPEGKPLWVVQGHAFTDDYRSGVKAPSWRLIDSVLERSDGRLVGRICPGPEVGGICAWVDNSHAIRAHRRANGEYLILLEDDLRGKRILYRWTPAAALPGQGT